MSQDGHTERSPVDERCQRAHAALRAGARPEHDSALAEHVAQCPACATLAAAPRLAAALGVASAPAVPIDAWLTEVEATLAKERGPRAWLRSRPSAQRTGLAVLGAGLVPLLVWLAWRRVDVGVYPSARLLLELVAVLVPMGLALALVMRPLHRPSWPRATEWLVLGLAVAGVLVDPLLEPAHHGHPASLGGTGSQLVPRAMVCLSVGTGLGLPALAWLVVLRRGGERLGPIGLVAGLVGTLAIFLHCPIVAPAHLLLGHATVLVVMAALVAAAGLGAEMGRLRQPR